MKPEQVESLIRQVAADVSGTLVKKNHDYGDSIFKNYEQFGDLSMCIRLSDKLGRLSNLAKQAEMRVDNEPIEDTYRDIAGYAIMALVSRMRLYKDRPMQAPDALLCGEGNQIFTTGTQPLTVKSTTMVSNLNVGMVEGRPGRADGLDTDGDQDKGFIIRCGYCRSDMHVPGDGIHKCEKCNMLHSVKINNGQILIQPYEI